MLPFGQNFSLGIPQPNLFRSNVIPGIPMPMIVSTNAPLLNNPVLVNCFAQSRPPQPMMIAPDVLNVIPHPDAYETKNEDTSPIEILSTSNTAPTFLNDNEDHWTEHKSNDGRVFYYNRAKNISSWTKPDIMKTPSEKEKSLWRIYKTAEGKEYYYNIQTKETTWTKPAILNEYEEVKVNKQLETTQEESKPISLLPDSTSDIERAMAATLLKFDNNLTDNSSLKASTSKKSAELSAAAEEQERDAVKRRQIDKFKELVKEKYESGRINTGMSWEQAMKFVQQDVRFRIIPKVSEKKQIYNAWKVQRSKEERDERRLAIKKSKEDLEKWLLSNPKMRSSLRYQKADSLFFNEPIWRAVSEQERREIFRDMAIIVLEREEKTKKDLHERNVRALADILDGIEEVTHRTTWAQAQRILIENPDFANDSVLQGMDKENALIVFQDHIRASEQLYVKEKHLEAKRIRRQERKVRENFMQFLHELNNKGILTSTSTWSALYPTISADQIFESTLMQTGSTALDLFKFYVEDLKNRYYEDRHIIREILNNLHVQVTINTTFEQLQQWVKSDERGKNVDAGNMKLCYNSLYDKSLAKERENEREIQRKQKRQESAFRNLLRTLTPDVEPQSEWMMIRERIKSEDAFISIESEDIREQLFNDYIKSISDACGHHHGNNNGTNLTFNSEKSKKKKKEKRKKRKKDDRDSDSEFESKMKKSKKSHTLHENYEKKLKKKNKRKSRSYSSVDEGEIIEQTSSTQTLTIKNISEDSEEMLSDVSATELERERSAILKKLTSD